MPLLPFFLAGFLGGPVIFVDASATGANDGSSWADAFTDLQSALAPPLHLEGEVWIAAGRYRPSQTGDRTASFRIGARRIYGGFDGTETSFDQRAGLFDQTILDGDLVGDDGPYFANRQDNSCHVVFATHWQTVIDGLTIRGGHADQPGFNSWGGGMLASYPVRVFATECRFVDNFALLYGGGVCLEVVEQSEFRRCTFLGNAAGVEGGGVGAKYNLIPDKNIFDRCRFLGNESRSGGGYGIGSARFIGCLFSGNRARGGVGGGAIDGLTLEITSCTFFENAAHSTQKGGGAIYYRAFFEGSPLPVRNSIFWRNADQDGEGFPSQIRLEPDCPYVQLDGSCVPEFHPTARGVGNLRTDPEFVDPLGPDGIAGTLDDDLRLRASSPCIDRADDAFLPALGPLDLAGRARAVDALSCGDGGVLDIGAYERQFVQGTTNYCPAAPSSLGVPAVLSGPCERDLITGYLALSAAPVPRSNGFFLFGPDRAETPFGDGFLCIGGTLHRTQLTVSQGGVLWTSIDLTDPVIASLLLPGTCWSFQAVYRDRASSGAAFNLSDAIRVTFH